MGEGQDGGDCLKTHAPFAREHFPHGFLKRVLEYLLPEVVEFRQAWEHFLSELPSVLESLREVVEDAQQNNTDFHLEARRFLDICHKTIGPKVSMFDVKEMLLQHILTKDIFLRVFAEDQFHRENNIARQLENLERTFFIGDVRRQALDRLRSSYGAVGRAADQIADYWEKQKFLKAIYEDFYKVYNPEAADYLGVVYTPNEVVDFIIRGTDYLLQKHFGRSLADKKVQILDPATGTGTFITSVIDYLPKERLEHKYLKEIHANEVAILPYYIANLNIEYSYREKTGKYMEFPNLCFVDTLDNLGSQEQGTTGGAVVRQSRLDLGAISEENWLRVQEQNEKPISVIIGNPPYNDRAILWGDGRDNWAYAEVDKRIRDTYVKESMAQRTHQYDMYKRFFRWASDRLADDGIVGFVTNNAYVDAHQDDGFRKAVATEFTDLYILDLGSDVRRNPKISGTTHNVFGIQTGVAIGFFVRDKAKLGQCEIHYSRREDAELAKDKLLFLRDSNIGQVVLSEILPDEKGNWIEVSNPNFANLLPVAERTAKYSRRGEDCQALFQLFSSGVKTNRDEWVFDFDVNNLRNKTFFFVETYNEFLESDNRSYDPIIKWSSTLQARFLRGDRIVHRSANTLQTLRRPFVLKQHFVEVSMNDRLTNNHFEMFGSDLKHSNKVICFRGLGTAKPFDIMAVNKLVEHQLLMNMQCLPLYRYTAEGEQVCNITDWGIRQFNDHYRRKWGDHLEELAGPEGITAEDIFAYTYAVLHDPSYRQEYGVDLLREFPRLPFYHDFYLWRDMGHELLDLHIGFEEAEPYLLELVQHGGLSGGSGRASRAILRAEKERGAIILDDKTTLTGVPPQAWEYQLGSRSALEWVLDQYKEKKPRDPTIAEKFNTYRFADYKEQVIDLLKRVCTVSVNTVEIVDRMARLERK